MKKVCGVGVNDMGTRRDPIYTIWRGMLRRCLPSEHVRHPTYKGCIVCKEWLQLSNFWKWAEKHWQPGLHLDKDIIQPGNKVYCPDFCCFVPQALNNLLTDRKASRGRWSQGVCYDKQTKLFQAYCRVSGVKKHLGSFETPEEAHQVYIKFKVNLIQKAAEEQTDERIKQGLLKHAELLLDTASVRARVE